jgi:hypothetical protein
MLHIHQKDSKQRSEPINIRVRFKIELLRNVIRVFETTATLAVSATVGVLGTLWRRIEAITLLLKFQYVACPPS